MTHTSILRFTTSLVALAALHTASFAAGPVEDIKSGSAAITLDNSFVTGLGLLLTDLTKIAPAAYSPGKHILTVPITGGAFDLGLAESDIISGGGFKLTKGGLHATFTDLIITLPDDHTKAEVSALYTNNTFYIGRITLGSFDSALLNIPTPVSLPTNKKIVIHNVPFKLSANAAATLNAALGVSNIFTAVDPVGLIEIKFKVAPKTL